MDMDNRIITLPRDMAVDLSMYRRDNNNPEVQAILRKRNERRNIWPHLKRYNLIYSY
jgi:hypothetical protein